jgi:alpha-tubulin suppressor-like RCC1 family protein
MCCWVVAALLGAQVAQGQYTTGSIVGWGIQVVGVAENLVAVAAGSSHGIGLKADGSMMAWGDNTSGQCNVPSPNTGFVAVAARYQHRTCFITIGPRSSDKPHA